MAGLHLVVHGCDWVVDGMSEQVDIWEDRRVNIGYETAEELAKHYNSMNWRAHPEAQRDATEDSLDALGYVGAIKKSLQSGVILDGHLRIEIALAKDPAMRLPVDYYDLSPDEEALALQVLDATTEMAEPIPDKLAALLARTREMTADRPGLGAMLERLRLKAEEMRPFNPDGIEFKEYDESAADDVEYTECPSCGHKFPK